MKQHHSKVLSGEKNGMFGKTHSDEVKKQMSISRKGMGKNKIVSEKTREKLQNLFIGKSYKDRYGKEKSLEIKKKQSISHKNRKRGYTIIQVNNDGNIIGKFNTIQEAVDILGISRKKAYKNNFNEFKFKKIYESV